MSSQPLEKRVYKYKNPAKIFYCPLCRSERAVTTSPKLRPIHYLQILVITAALIYLFYPIMKFESFFFFFIIWGGFEFSVRILFRKEVPCPYCGFDASWYKRDVKVARKLVQDFWEKKKVEAQGPEKSPSPSKNEKQVSA